MNTIMIVLFVLTILLMLVSIYQHLVMRSALRIAEILYVMSRNVRAKASEVRKSKKDVEIIEAHLFDIATSARCLLKALGRSEKAIDPDPALSVATNGHRMSSDSLIRLADNILFSVREETPDMSWEDAVSVALERFQRKVPELDQEAARRIIGVVVAEHRGKATQQMLTEHDLEEALFSGTAKS